MEWTKDTWDTERWPSFTFSEMRCKETDTNRMDKEFMDMLQQLRHRIGQPTYIASGYRDASHSAEKSKKNAGYGPHQSGKAVDIKV